MIGSTKQNAILRRLAQAIPVVVIATFLVFSLLKLVPGDIAVTLAGDNASDARIAEIRQIYGLDQPFLGQYFSWLGNVVQGDLSRSLLSGESVGASIARSFPNTLLIVVLAILIALVLGIPLGVVSASRPGGVIDTILLAIGSLGIAVPNFWLAMLLVSFFALNMNWLPATGAVPLTTSISGALAHAILPAVALAAGGVAEVMRQLRSSLVEILGSQHVRTLHAKGLSPSAILWRHSLKNVSVNLLTVTSLLFNRLFAATVVIEAVFAIPGMGSLVVKAAMNRDFPVVQGVVFVMVLVVVGVNLLTDILYRVFDPRVAR
ncbi:ABC transporter permease [Hoeflea alexandrii]|uniref:ABC transporter permease n=1 Tax=Hoeflea alexandrii TaxID=288436 RepID=UPI0022AE69C7|nr:ABC transporter permease [Hoeflea alexandrii]MCZ4291555.1 ABC transporter permease [Hoeflea alexandrii]